MHEISSNVGILLDCYLVPIVRTVRKGPSLKVCLFVLQSQSLPFVRYKCAHSGGHKHQWSVEYSRKVGHRTRQLPGCMVYITNTKPKY